MYARFWTRAKLLLNNSLLNKNNKFTPFVVAVGTTIDNETNKNISITNGKVTDTGSRNIAVAISSPGLYEYTNIKEFKDLNKVVISYETTDFEINDIYMVASPKLLSELDFDIFNKLRLFISVLRILFRSFISFSSENDFNKYPEACTS